MGLETGNYIYDLVQSNPPAGDQRKEGDDHIRLIKKVIQQSFPHLTGPTLPTSTGTANAQVVTHLFGPPALLPAQLVAFIAGFTNTGPMTLAVNGLAAKNVYVNGAPVLANSIIVGGLYVLMYDGVQFQMAGSYGLGGYLPLSGGTLTGALTVPNTLSINGAAGTTRTIFGTTSGSTRWAIVPGNSIAEGGSNAGSDFQITRYNDAGAVIDLPLSINRASGSVTLTGPSLTLSPPANANLFMNKPASGNANIIWGQTGGVARWLLLMGTGAAESGSNVGSDFNVTRCNDAGTQIDTPLSISRSTGFVSIGTGGLQVAGNAVVSSSAAASLELRKGSGGAGIPINIAGTMAGSNRWIIQLGNGLAETGSNIGSDLGISRYSDGNALIDTPITTKRSTGVTTFSVAIVNGPSDRSLKENIQPLDGALDKVMALKGVSFNFIKDKTKRQIGLIAQDVAPIVPEVMQDFIQPDEEPKLAIDYTRLVPVLIEAIKELTARVGALEKLWAGGTDAQGN